MYIPSVTKSTPIVGSPVSMSLENSRRANIKLILYLIPCLAGRLYGRDRANSRGSSASLLNVRSISFMRHGYRKLEGLFSVPQLFLLLYGYITLQGNVALASRATLPSLAVCSTPSAAAVSFCQENH